MSALLDAQSQSSARIDDDGIQEPIRCAEGPVRADRRRRRRQDQQDRNSKTRSAPAAPISRNADSVFGKLDKDGDGSVSLKELASALKGGKRSSSRMRQRLQRRWIEFRSVHAGAAGCPAPSVTNSDGSVTTSLTYADGSKVTMTSAARGSSSSAATSSYNFIEQMIQRQAQAISSATTASLSVSA